MTAPTLTTDQAGKVVLTTEQALLLARWWADDLDAGEFETTVVPLDDAVTTAGDISTCALYHWIIRAAPVVRAAEAQMDAANVCHNETTVSEAQQEAWQNSVVATEAAVRAYRDGQPEDAGAATMQERIDLAQGFIEGLCGDGGAS